jgi:hypothetical protein
MRVAGAKRAIAGLSTLVLLATLLALPAAPASAQANPAPCEPAGPTATSPGPTVTSPGSTTTETTPSTTGSRDSSSGSTGSTDAASEATQTSASATSSTTETATADRCETFQALQHAMPSVLAYSLNPPTTTPNPGAVLTTEGDDITVDVPKAPDAGVRLNAPSTPPIAVGLPAGESAKPAVLANQGVAVYQHARPQTSLAVQPVGLGAVRVMEVIGGPKAPTSYRFPLRIPPGGSIRRVSPAEDRYVIVDANGDGMASISAPWSHDSDGRWVPTSYRVDGQTLVQEVDHAGFTYPVVADPLVSLGCAWLQCSVYLSRSATRTLKNTLHLASNATTDAIALAAATACLALSGGTAAVICEYAGKLVGQALVTALSDAVNQGGCLRIGYRPPFFISASSVSATNSTRCSDGVGYGTPRPLQQGDRLVTALNASGQNATYLVVGGAKLWISSREEFAALGYDWSIDEHMSPDEVKQFTDVPIDGTLVKERSDPHTFVISGRHRWWITDNDQFTRNHFDWNKVHIVANGSLVSCPYAGPLPETR